MSLRRLFALLTAFVLALALYPAAAQERAGCPPPAPAPGSLDLGRLAPQARDRGLLWRLDKGGRTSWLYGTVHLSRPEWLLPGPAVRRALASSDLVALELDPADPELARAFLAAGNPARTMRVLDGLQGRLDALAAKACLPAATPLATLGPLLQVLTVGLQESRRDGLHPELAVDLMLWGFARSAGKAVVALETAAAQLAALQPESEAEERALVEQSLQDLETGEARRLTLRLAMAWAESDHAQISNYAQWCQCTETAAERRLLERLNDRRNPALAARLVALHDGGQRFFAGVGALHMTGPASLPRLLAQEGFRVQLISFQTPP